MVFLLKQTWNWSSGSGKINSLFYSISQQPDIDKMYLYDKDSNEAKHQLPITKGESVG